MDKGICVGYTPQGEFVREIPPKRRLAIFAHPGDESITAGGMLAKYAHEGVRVVLLCLTRGEAGIPGLPPKFAGPIRTAEMRRAEEQLGIEAYVYGYNTYALSCRVYATPFGIICAPAADMLPEKLRAFCKNDRTYPTA